MQSMKVDKEKLIKLLKVNRDAHRKSFLAAQKVYRELVIKELDFMLKEAKKGSNIRRHVNLKAPEDHTADYDKLLGLLEMSSDAAVDLTVLEYSNYVDDNWAWSIGTKALASNYTSRNVSPMFVGENVSLPLSY